MPEQSVDTLDLSALPFWQWDTVAPAQPEGAEPALGLTLDSLLPPREIVAPAERPSMFRHHALQREHPAASERPASWQPAWVFVALVALSALLCLYYKIRKIKLLPLLKSTIDGRALDRLVRECNLNRGVVMVSMGLLLMMAVSLAGVRLLTPQVPWWIYPVVAAAAGGLYVLRNGLMRWLGNVFERRQAVAQYITSNYVYHLVEASMLTVGMYFLFYLPQGEQAVLIVLGALLAAGFIMRMWRGVKIILTHPSGADFYLFYYLCIVEMVPAVVAVRAFMIM